MSENKYAGFWLRFVAYLIDAILLNCINWLVIFPVMGAIGFGIGATATGFDFDTMSEGDIIAMATAVGGMLFAGGLIGTVINILYFTLMEASKYQATIGKLALGLKVTDMDGKKLDFTKALIRQVGKIVSGIILLIGYIMAGFTEKKQALHDMIAGTLVVKK
ncbi:RDD family protein [Ekhidna sp.]|uniref:RDD family protein n=1 Tax=Ekhidna sp. TaxID=2608089 RepID=UPI0032EDE993